MDTVKVQSVDPRGSDAPPASPGRIIRSLALVLVVSASLSGMAYAAVTSLSAPGSWVMKAVTAAVALETGMVTLYASNMPSAD
jgi:predicted MarR family transcription regulator